MLFAGHCVAMVPTRLLLFVALIPPALSWSLVKLSASSLFLIGRGRLSDPHFSSKICLSFVSFLCSLAFILQHLVGVKADKIRSTRQQLPTLRQTVLRFVAFSMTRAMIASIDLNQVCAPSIKPVGLVYGIYLVQFALHF
jgi:hypothetical protein